MPNFPIVRLNELATVFTPRFPSVCLHSGRLSRLWFCHKLACIAVRCSSRRLSGADMSSARQTSSYVHDLQSDSTRKGKNKNHRDGVPLDCFRCRPCTASRLNLQSLFNRVSDWWTAVLCTKLRVCLYIIMRYPLLTMYSYSVAECDTKPELATGKLWRTEVVVATQYMKNTKQQLSINYTVDPFIEQAVAISLAAEHQK